MFFQLQLLKSENKLFQNSLFVCLTNSHSTQKVFFCTELERFFWGWVGVGVNEHSEGRILMPIYLFYRINTT